MSLSFVFGKHKDKTFDEVAEKDPEYLLWVNGTLVNKFSLSANGKGILKKINEEHSECVALVQAYVKDNPLKIKNNLDSIRDLVHAKVMASSPSRNYHYHPYGKKD